MKTTKRRPMTKAERFFYDHAGYSYDPQKETRAQGRRRCAVELAAAEARAEAVGLVFKWEDDEHDHEDCDAEYAEWCGVYAADDTRAHPETLASLGMVCGADVNDYRRVVQAELASEALAVLDGRDAAVELERTAFAR